MNIKLKYKVRFYPESRKVNGNIKTDNVPLLFSFHFDGLRLKSTTGLKIEKLNHWSKSDQRFRPSVANAAILNKSLSQISEALEKIYLTAKHKGLTLSVDYVKIQLAAERDIKKKGFYDVLHQFVREESVNNSWMIGTVKRFTVLESNLKAFESERRQPIKFSSIDRTFYSDYIQFLLKRKYKNTYIKQFIKTLKWYFDWCKKQGIEFPYDYSEFKFKGNTPSPGQNVRPLTLDQLSAVFNHHFDDVILSQVRDCFCFTCFTGLRYSDLRNLKKADVQDGNIKITSLKTAESLTIPLIAPALAIIERYQHTFSPKALPVPSEGTYNNALKRIGEICRINDEITQVNYTGNNRIESKHQKWQRMTSHVGRQTFITTGITLGVPGAVIQELTGQSNDAMVRTYYKILDTEKSIAMTKFETAYQNGRSV